MPAIAVIDSDPPKDSAGFPCRPETRPCVLSFACLDLDPLPVPPEAFHPPLPMGSGTYVGRKEGIDRHRPESMRKDLSDPSIGYSNVAPMPTMASGDRCSN